MPNSQLSSKLRSSSKRRRSKSKRQKLVPNQPEPLHQETEEEQEEEEEDEGNGFKLKTSAKHGVQPLGNLYFINKGAVNVRNTGLGNLHVLTDELVLEILALLGAAHLGVLATVTKSLYVFANHEPLWRNLVLEELKGEFFFTGSWKSTYVAAASSHKFESSGESVLKIRDFYSDYLFQSWLCANLEMRQEWLERDNIVRVRGISVEDFITKFEEPNKPVLLEGCLDDWPAVTKWTKEYLTKVSGDVEFAVGPVEMKLENYFRYSDGVTEERPLYLFDPKFAEKVTVLDSEYDVPVYFKEDLFSVLGRERPDYRWIIIGPSGSGSSFHIDPNSTSAWNAVITGSKKWVLFPPDVVPPGVHPSPDGAEVACPVSIMEWFMNFYGDTKNWKKRPVECICRAGEVVFVPNGWWHLVINLEESVAITQNYVSRRNLLNVLEFLKKPNAKELVSGTNDRENLHDKFKKAIEEAYPGTIQDLEKKAEEKRIAEEQKVTFWDAATDSKSGAFKFSF
ncbi:F-box protein [Hirschfeldia incana]|nr:F-box protein [Hirschfeldia incana]